jgi:hypothetical protein
MPERAEVNFCAFPPGGLSADGRDAADTTGLNPSRGIHEWRGLSISVT